MTVEFISVPAKSTHSATIILVHGLGDSGHGLKHLALQLQAQGLEHCKFILPSAPIRAITANSGRRMPAWYDVKAFTPASPDDEAQMLESLAWIEELVAAEVDAGTPLERIVVGGFSQGATLSLLLGLVSAKRVRGVLVLSGRLPLRDAASQYPKLKELKPNFKLATPHATSKSTPIFWAHGVADPLITHQLALSSVEFLTSVLGVQKSAANNDDINGLTFKSYPNLGHSIDEQEISDLTDWLHRALP
ncbi:Phospholipase/carboxylesterase [Mycena chlorophos]|uniref:Acyl-protein thioesterase 1 n=1 Tax=Mycena chlorophos TaxID=658473 RepID=A0A8H6T5S0_MYCCL|nr:Phospholipase/carboxylesterase [Mycena chlorophos]